MAAEQPVGDGERINRDGLEITGMDNDLLYGGNQESAAESFGIGGDRRGRRILAVYKDYASHDFADHFFPGHHVHHQFPAGL